MIPPISPTWLILADQQRRDREEQERKRKKKDSISFDKVLENVQSGVTDPIENTMPESFKNILVTRYQQDLDTFNQNYLFEE